MKTTREEERLTDNEIIANCNVFMVGSYDTTVTAAKSILYYLSHDIDLQSKLREEIINEGMDKEDINIEILDTCPLLNDLVKEGCRMHPSAFMLFDKKVCKDFTLGKYTFRKNDLIVVPLASLMWSTEYFSKGRTFELGSINSQNKKAYMPFWGGKRACVGQFLAEMELKLLVIEALKIGTLMPVTKLEEIEYHLSITPHLVNARWRLIPHSPK